jgi:hypothetical protein
MAKLVLEEGCISTVEIASGDWTDMMELYNGSEYQKLFQQYGFPDRRSTFAQHGANFVVWDHRKTGRMGDLKLSVS